MNYQKIYDAIVERRKRESPLGYFEAHHIVPRSLGGSDSSDNLVKLTAREHFVCHLLLVKIYVNTPSYYKMVKAFFMMQTSSDNQQRHFSSRNYERLRKMFSTAQSLSVLGKLNPSYGKVWCVEETAQDCMNRKMFNAKSIPDGWITTSELKRRKNAQKRAERQLAKQTEMISKLRDQYKLYSLVGYDKFVEQTGYKYSKPNLVQTFARWLPEFVPQNGKKR